VEQLVIGGCPNFSAFVPSARGMVEGEEIIGKEVDPIMGKSQQHIVERCFEQFDDIRLMSLLLMGGVRYIK
jgi:hypothetical protein